MPAPSPRPLDWLKPSELSDSVPDFIASSLRDWQAVAALGSASIMRSPLLAFFCSIRCPGDLILETYDLSRAIRDASVPVVSGFHTPMEKECLDLLLRGKQPIVMCPARSIEGMRLASPLKTAVQADRLLLLSPFGKKDRRPTAKLAEERNRFVAALATEVFVAYANEGGKTQQLCRDLIATGKPVLTFDSPANAPLMDMGCTPVTATELVERWSDAEPNSSA